MKPPMKVRIGNLHNMCENNTLFLSRARNYFRLNGHIVVDGEEEPDIFFIGGCAVTDRMRSRCEGIIEEYMRKYGNACLVVFGCLAAFPARLLEMAAQNAARLQIIPYDESRELDELIRAQIPYASVSANRLYGHFPYQPTVGPEDSYVLIAQGCVNACSYCNIKRAKGHVKSRPVEEIEAEVLDLYRRGERTATLLADDCGSYGLDLDGNLPGLLTRLCQMVPEMRFKLLTVFPAIFLRYAEQLVPFFAERRISYICLPVQSASPRILELMNRRYEPDKLARAVARIRLLAPDVFVYSHFIYNFPTETREDFEQSIAFARHFDHCVFIGYGENKGTPAAKLAPKCGDLELEQKTRRLESLLEQRRLSAFLVPST